jgi:DNA-binding MarR family transcriptional regulator
MPPSLDQHRQQMPEGPHGDLQHALFRVLKSLVFRGDPNSAMNEMPISQLKCLHIVGESEGLKMIDIAHRMEIGLPAVSQIVDRLVRRGLFERQPDPVDRRVVRVVLTGPARDLIGEARQYRQQRMDATLERLDVESIDTVTHALELLAVAAEHVEAKERASQPPMSERAGEEQVHVSADPLVELIAERARSRRRKPGPELLPAGDSGRQ